MHRDESRTQGLDRLELIRFLQVAQTIAVRHGMLAHLLRIKALRASEPVLGRDVLLWRVPLGRVPDLVIGEVPYWCGGSTAQPRSHRR